MIMENKGENTYEESDFYRNAGSWKEYGRSGCRKTAGNGIYRYRFIDSEAGGTSAQRDYSRCGEDGFLAIENQVNCQVNAEHAVISPGGSVVYCEEAMKHFKEIGTVVYLKASYRTIKERIRSPKKRGVVLREGQTFRDLYEERTKLFEQYADLTICEDGCQIEETIDAVLTQIEALEKK